MIEINGKKFYGEVQLAVVEVHHDPKVGKGLWKRIFTKVMAREIC